MVEWINNNWVEITGAILAFIYLILEIKRKWIFWIVGIVSSVFYIYIFFHTKLYAEMGLQCYYVVMSAYGLYCWKFSSTAGDENQGFRHIDTKTTFVLSALFAILFLLIINILRRYTDSQVPIADALITILSILATWMAAKKIVECWHIWIFVNIFATGLYIHQKLYPTAVLFTVYSILSFVGLMEWRKSIKTK
jgi:nicotinamide mononucleotide transporter